jgi:HEAT repeat protein
VLSPPNDAAKTAEVARLIAVLQSEAAPLDKAKACQRLALIGTKEAVPALAALLTDERLSGYARFGLEPIADPSVDDALRDALGKLHGELLLGVINSIGYRRDAKAVAALARRLDDPAPEVALKSLAALGQIATPEAVDTLQRALSRDSAAVRAAAADACLTGAERLLAQDQREAPARLYDAVRRADVAQQQRAAAARGAILTRQSAGVVLLLEQLKADDADAVGMALRTSRELPGSEVTRSLLAALDSLPSKRQALLLRAIGDRRDAAALPAIRARASRGPKEVRSAAIDVLGQLRDVSAASLVLEAALSGDSELAQAAQESLKQLRGRAVDEAVVARPDRADPKTRVVMLNLVGRLTIASASLRSSGRRTIRTNKSGLLRSPRSDASPGSRSFRC